MQQLITDAGTAWILQQVLPHGKEELRKILDKFNYAADHKTNIGTRFTMDGANFPAELKIKKIVMDLEPIYAGRKPFILATVEFGKGVRWRRGSLRIANVTIPHSPKIAIKGKRIRDVVEGAPFPDFTIRNIVEDKSSKGTTLRIMCNESDRVAIKA